MASHGPQSTKGDGCQLFFKCWGLVYPNRGGPVFYKLELRCNSTVTGEMIQRLNAVAALLRGSQFNSQHPYDSLQQSVTPVSEGKTPSQRHTCSQSTNAHKFKKESLKIFTKLKQYILHTNNGRLPFFHVKTAWKLNSHSVFITSNSAWRTDELFGRLLRYRKETVPTGKCRNTLFLNNMKDCCRLGKGRALLSSGSSQIQIYKCNTSFKDVPHSTPRAPRRTPT